MVGVIIVAHGDLAQAFKDATERIMGPQPYFKALSVGAYNNVEKERTRLKEAIKEVDAGNGVLILTDMFGGTPSNLSLSFLEEDKIEVLTGVNLPILIKLFNLRNEPLGLERLRDTVCTYGREKIVAASDLLKQKLIKQG